MTKQSSNRWAEVRRGDPPADCPFEPSDVFHGVRFTGRHASYTKADTWWPSWAADGDLYSPWADGTVDEWACGCPGPLAMTGHARIAGDDPLDLEVIPLGTRFGGPGPYGARFPSGSLVHDGVWYYGTYCVSNSGRKLNWDILGPFVGFRISHDFGKTWIDGPHTPEEPIFGESAVEGIGWVRIGIPHFVDFGQNLEHSPDGRAYMVAHGATRPYGNAGWISGDGVHLCRVMPSPETINDPAAWEFYAGGDRWSSQVEEASPLIEWQGHIGHAGATWFPELGRYLLCVTDGWPTISTMSSMILESESLTGPWRLVSFLRDFGPQAYFLNFPSKFVGNGGTTAWLCYSANFTAIAEETHGIKGFESAGDPSPEGSCYAMCLQEIELLC